MEHVVHATALKAEASLPEVTEAILHATVGRQGEQARVRRTATRTRERRIGVRQCQPGTKASKDARFGLPYSWGYTSLSRARQSGEAYSTHRE